MTEEQSGSDRGRDPVDVGPATEAEVWQRGYAAGLERGRQADNHPALNPLLMAFAIDKHTLAYGPTEPIHDGGTCSTDCAADVARRYADEVTMP